jgi:hypothetical protein
LSGARSCVPTRCPVTNDSIIQRDGSVGKCTPDKMTNENCRSCIPRTKPSPSKCGGKKVSLISIAPLDRLLS